MRIGFLIIPLLTCGLLPMSHANELLEVDSEFFYEIGGEYVLPSGFASRSDMDLRLSGSATLGYSCGKFDPKLALRDAFNNLRDELSDTQDAIVNAATSSIAALPMYLLQRANPDAASLLKNYEFDLGQKINLATKSCEQLERDILEGGENPITRWVSFGKMATWRSGVEQGDTVRTVDESVKQDAGQEGIDWAGEKAGGRSQPPIVLNRDISRFGYNALLGRALRDESPAPVGNRFSSVFPTPQSLTDFIVEVVGDAEISVAEDAGPLASIPPKGLHNAIENRRLEIQDLLVRVLTAEATDTTAITELNDIARSGAILTLGLIDGLGSLSRTEQLTAVSKLASEYAMHEMIDKSLLALRAMHAGRLTPDVMNSPAYDQFLLSIERLEAEIHWLEFEMQVRDRLLTDTETRVIAESRLRGGRLGIAREPSIEYVTPEQRTEEANE